MNTFSDSRNFEAALSQALQQENIPRDKKHFETTLLLAKKEVCRIQNRRRITFAQFLAAQITFIGWKIWTMQGLFLSAIHIFLFRLCREDAPRHIVSLLFCLSVLVLMTTLPFLYRSVRYQMQEVESAARFSLVKLLTAKLAMIGIGDLFMLGGIFLVTLWKTSLSAESIVVSLCFPFLLACCGCLFMLEHLDAKSFYAGSAGLCSFLILLDLALLRYCESMLRYALSGKWLLVCVPLLALCIFQCRHLIYRSSYAEMQLS